MVIINKFHIFLIYSYYEININDFGLLESVIQSNILKSEYDNIRKDSFIKETY